MQCVEVSTHVIKRDLRVDGDLTVRGKVHVKGVLLEEKLKELEAQVEKLIEAQNESREQIQALLDYCFADRSAWKEGQKNASAPKTA